VRQSYQEEAAGLGVSDAVCQAAITVLPLCHPESPQPSDGHWPPDCNPKSKSSQVKPGWSAIKGQTPPKATFYKVRCVLEGRKRTSRVVCAMW